jgi:hypothetical protein
VTGAHWNACCEDKIEITTDETLKECDVAVWSLLFQDSCIASG